jgi:hypothetical protein
MRGVFWTGHDIRQVVHAIAEVDVCMSTFGKHYFCSFCAQVIESVTGSVIRCPIRFGFYNDPATRIIVYIGNENFPQKIFCKEEYIF